MTKKSIVFLLALCAAVASCTIQSEIQTDETGVISQAAGCGNQGCGSNAATVGDGVFFDEIDASGVFANAGGVKLVDATGADFMHVNIHVAEDDLIATGMDGAESKGKQLTGLVLTFAHTNEAKYSVRLDDVGTTRFWTKDTGEVPIYKFTVRKLARATSGTFPPGVEESRVGDERPLCTGEHLENEALWRDLQYYAVVFQGDRHDSGLKTVTETKPHDPWFSLACIGTSMAKMHLIRHTLAGSQQPKLTTTVPERQAMLKMLTADYCGDGQSFTENGWPLSYEDSNGWFVAHPVKAAAKFEAVWGPEGAICLDTPRKEPLAKIQEACRKSRRGATLPPCGKFWQYSWRSYYHVASALPYAP